MQTTWNWLMEMHTFAKVIVVVLLRVTRETKEVMMQACRTCVGTETRKTNNKYTWRGDLQTIWVWVGKKGQLQNRTRAQKWGQDGIKTKTKKKPGKRKNRWSMLVVSVQHPQSKGKGKLTSKQAVWDTGKQFDQQSTTCNMKMKGDYYTKMQVMGWVVRAWRMTKLMHREWPMGWMRKWYTE